MDAINKVDYKIRNLNTRSVTLFPSRAQIYRDIKNIPLQPGTNEITIQGLSPSVDQDSIKVEVGPAFAISDVSIEALPNRDIFEEIHPELDSDETEGDEDDDDLEFTPWKESPELKKATQKLDSLHDARTLADEAVSSAESRLKLLDTYSKTWDRKKGPSIAEESLQTYKEQRSRVYGDYMAGLAQQRAVIDKMEDQINEVHRLQKLDDKARAKAEKLQEKIQKAKEKDSLKKARQREERRKEKERLRIECQKFWPKYCYTVKITLEMNPDTPFHSRRTSLSSSTMQQLPESDATEATHDKNAEAGTPCPQCDLVLSYVTSAAYWVPSYDLQLWTTTATGTLSFDAELHNWTSETWTNSKVVLSTSQATFSGLDDAIPTLEPWYVSLVQGPPPYGHGRVLEEIARSGDEVRNAKEALERQKLDRAHNKSRGDMFGVQEEVEGRLLSRRRGGRSVGRENDLDGRCVRYAAELMPLAATTQTLATPISASDTGHGGGGAATTTKAVARSNLPGAPTMRSSRLSGLSGLFGASSQPAPNVTAFGNAASPRSGAVAPSPNTRAMLRGVVHPTEKQPLPSRQSHEPTSYSNNPDEDDSDTSSSSSDESIMSETGLTSTYHLPSPKTLPPKTTPTKHRVAHIRLTNITYTHTVIPKHSPVAYLKAKFKNTSKTTLFKGRTALRLDGSFMGRTILPRCSAGETFVLSLGIDPAIQVTYPRPVIQRARTSAGLFSKENSAVFTRCITLHNTRAGGAAAAAATTTTATSTATATTAATMKATSVIVLDQVPLSQDEKLRVDILTPLGLSVGGAEVRTGTAGLEAGENTDWGSARASLRRDGEVLWDVSLNAGKAVRLTLEYGVAFPNGTWAC
ncbi:hypothetical protein E4U60_007809 [Claviceps pazoutovae]|uniref:Mucoidy inhibitor-like protein n=1 Tax=Claviceps pazoutovae TaxID=1649127 RepID=A0A9P7MEV9_9HYPO|nr:hypothetical protein E4U60_007809 [Claviceps pazoutovae]